MASTPPQRWARVPPPLAWKRPGLPSHWVRVLERYPDGAIAQPEYVWLDMPGKVSSVGAHELEFREAASSGERQGLETVAREER